MDDLSQMRPCLLPGVRIVREGGGQGGERWIVHAPGGRCFLAGTPEVALLALMDGTRGIEELSRVISREAPGLDTAGAVRFVRRLTEAGLVLEGEGWARSFPPFSTRLVIADAGPLLVPICRLLRRIPTWAAAAGFAALLVAGAASGGAHADRFRALYSPPETTRLLALALLVWILGLPHELAHAAAALTLGARVATLVVAVAPWHFGFRVQLADAAILPRCTRAWVAAWGPLWDAALGSGALIAGRIMPAHGEAAALLAAAALLRAAWNLLPVLGTDGACLLALGARAFRSAARSAMNRR